ncbi:hypothetical protein GALMADRAFT_134336 [Galerina marginata CBS 339.88]|uniref:Amidohydrolase-related domain-containing protein n=1 Tax=Galerina marginata (strain CBS 339.88) TaxID=685588 RepID=A0A067TUV8_GALM3|nr:hypothetical protein GALMADRAFT_134336 [Galerina marginata CBS 339.88]
MKDGQTSLPDGDIVVKNVHLAYLDKDRAAKIWSVQCHGGRVLKISPSGEDARSTEVSESVSLEDPTTSSVLDAQGGLMLPSLCHSHIHLDKCFILDRCGELVKGDFAEAMEVTKAAKSEFSKRSDDLYNRGARIIRESIENGVTAMRAHIEVDTSVGFACLDAAVKLQDDYHGHCEVQIAIFAQEPLFDSLDHQEPGQNFILLKEAAQRLDVDVVGSAPYVEPSIEQAKKNIGLIFDVADAQRINHVDFHLDYNLDPNSEPLVYEVIAQATTRYRGISATEPHSKRSTTDDVVSMRDFKSACPRITIGHATRLQLFSAEQWRELAAAISDLPITFVGLPQSDMYMQGRGSKDEPLGAPRGTLRVPYIAQHYGIEVAMSVNNVENAFTPQGSLDPLSLCAFGVGLFQAATPEDIRTLARSVSLTSKRAIGQTQIPLDLAPNTDDPADFVVLHGSQSLQSAVLNPCFDRTTIKSGKVVASRRSVKWFSS